jgi:hypothetical protein
VAALAAFAVGLFADDAKAVIKGSTPSVDRHTVRVVRGGIRCSGVAIARKLVATARHCGRGSVIAGGMHLGLAGSGQSAVLDDGRRVTVIGDAAILRLTSPLPASVTPAPVGDGDGDTYIIAGYGTADERHRGAYGHLREATLVSAERFALVDPNRTGSIGASACFGDSGGPVLRGGTLVGIVTRAAHPSPRIACGHLTRYAPILVSGSAAAATETAGDGVPVETHRTVKRKKRIAAKPLWRPFWSLSASAARP